MIAGRPPALARLDDEGRRLYAWNGRGYLEEFYSVTTIIGAAPKYLVPWASKLVAELAYNDVAEMLNGRRRGARAIRLWAKRGREYVELVKASGGLKSIDPAKLSERDLALRWLKGEPERVRDAAADRGKAVHAAAEDVVLENVREGFRLMFSEPDRMPEWPEQIRPWMVNGFAPWVRHYRPRVLSTEATVYNRSQVYAGTSDIFVEVLVDGEWQVLCVDYKSGRATYPEVALQTCAYARGEFIGGPDRVTEYPLPPVSGTAVLHITDHGYSFDRLRYDDVIFASFLYVRETFRWAIETSKSAFLGPIAPDLEDSLVASIEAIAP